MLCYASMVSMLSQYFMIALLDSICLYSLHNCPSCKSHAITSSNELATITIVGVINNYKITVNG